MTNRFVECIFVGPPVLRNDVDGSEQAGIVMELIQNRSVDGIAVSVRNADLMAEVFDKALEAGIPAITFDSDSAMSSRLAYVGTNNFFFGTQIAKVLQQLQPNGGTFAAVSSFDSPNLLERLEGFLHQMEQAGNWIQIENSPADINTSEALYMETFHRFASLENPPTAIIPVMASAMRTEAWKGFIDVHRNKNITVVAGDSTEFQLRYFERNYVNGLVGQMPYEMGSISASLLYSLISGGTVPREIIGTNVLTYVQVPLELPKLEVDNNLIGHLRYVGFVLFGFAAFMSFTVLAWIVMNRAKHVVKISQPSFLVMVVVGALVLSSAMIPLSMEDGGDFDAMKDRKRKGICMSVPWLASTGFAIIFSALFAKTYRVNRLFHTGNSLSRVLIQPRDVALPFVCLLAANSLILIVWTIQDPLMYSRQDLPGTDGWNRVIATYGSCQSENVWRYLGPLSCLNLGCLLLANWQAYETRMIDSELSESKYIGLSMASMLQSMLIGFPVLLYVRENPPAFYLTLVFVFFACSSVVLLLIFTPKTVLVYQLRHLSHAEQRNYILTTIRKSSIVAPTSDYRRSIAGEDSAAYVSDAQVFEEVPDATSLPRQHSVEASKLKPVLLPIPEQEDDEPLNTSVNQGSSSFASAGHDDSQSDEFVFPVANSEPNSGGKPSVRDDFALLLKTMSSV